MSSRPFSLAYSIADQSFVATKSLGILNLSLHLVEALSPRPEIERLEVFSNSSLAEWAARLPSGTVHCFDNAYATRAGRMLWDQNGVYVEARKHDVEWLFLPKGFASFLRTPRMKVAAYVHDVIGEHYRQRFPGAVSRTEAWYFRRSLVATLRHATVIFTNSDFTRRELLTLSGRCALRPPPIVVAGMGFSPVTTATRSDRRRIVVLASPFPHKRTDLAVEFMKAWQDTTDFAGRVHWVGRFPAGLIQPSDPRWEYHDRLDDSAYRALLAESKALVYFSEYEGFGMPPVEAVLDGICPVYSELPATRETMGGVGAPFENSSFESFAAAMRKALLMNSAELASAAASLSSRHNWPVVADRIISTMQSSTMSK